MACFVCMFVAVFLAVEFGNAKISRQTTFLVDQRGQGNFTSIQAAIDSVPSDNENWICIRINEGVYREQVKIPYHKPFIYLEGAGQRRSFIIWDAHDSTATSATFTSQADNIVAKSITFINSYNYPFNGTGNPRKPAVAALIEGDKSEFHRCAFFGLQDTLWDGQGRHYFRKCTIQGAVDFIFGSGQSYYESCRISVIAGALNGTEGYITAQGRSHPNETNGFVFNNCIIYGNGKTYLGRPWREYARVIFYNTTMSDIIVPEGWYPWFSAGKEDKLTFDESKCTGLGSNASGRVSWANKLTPGEIQQFTNISFINDGSWI